MSKPTATRADSSAEDALPTQASPSQAAAGPSTDAPERLGRYRVTGVLGGGGFGVVYRGYDEELCRDVAIKVPHPERLARLGAAEAYLAEARALARLDHPAIVPVYDVGRTAEGACYLVSKLVPGTDLARRLREGRPTFAEAAETVARVAEALHHAHQHQVVHRDVKPSNILIDRDGRPVVADFGLALRDEEVGTGPPCLGTPAYMSPEQARGEGHRVDARTDVYSLGVVLFELLTGRRPFRTETVSELLEQVKGHEPRPPRQLDGQVPRELDRICLKAMAKRAADRYSTAADLAEDLRAWLQQTAGTTQPEARPCFPAALPTPPPAPPAAEPRSDSRPVRVVPRGLRAFDAEDADFFLELLPGPRDRDGLPESIRFWRVRLDSTDPDRAFRVGLLYGPSGSGKSSLVRAGILPRLGGHVTAVFAEAAPDGTEARLLGALCRHFPELPADRGLAAAVAELRRGRGPGPGRKVLLVLDQLEQWLHGAGDEPRPGLVEALRQCDGSRVQAIVLVRDDFWMAATRFMRELEVPIAEGQNSLGVDLFAPRHARKVLAALGRAYGALPDGDPTPDQARFLDQAVAGLAQDGKVAPVRLSLFAEMVKGRPWETATLRQLGGTEGIGVTFFEEAFSAPTAPPAHRWHEPAARAVLQALLPGPGSDLKGHVRSQAELLTASGYEHRPEEFEALLRILDGELRLVTPAEPAGKDEGQRPKDEKIAGSVPPFVLPPSSARYYQLTHDYLVAGLRQWLTRKQRETWRGRAALRLAEQAAAWQARPTRRNLPAWYEWLALRLLTRRRQWSELEQRMMGRARRWHTVRGVGLLLVLALAGAWTWWAVERQGREQARLMVQALGAANTAEVPRLLEELRPYRRWADPQLTALAAQTRPDSKERLHAALALAADDPGQLDYLRQRLLTAQPDEFPAIRQALGTYQAALTPGLWAVLADATEDPDRRFRAACALALYDPQDPRWAAVSDEVASRLVRQGPFTVVSWAEVLRPVRGALVHPLAGIFRDTGRPETERSLACTILAAYATDQPAFVADLVMDADPRAFGVLFPLLRGRPRPAAERLAQELERQPSASWPDDRRDDLARRQARAAAALWMLGRPDAAFRMLRHRPDPRARTWLIHLLGPLGADPASLVRRLADEGDVSARRALLLALGEFPDAQLPADLRDPLAARLLDVYRTDPDPGMHSAVRWLLGRWGRVAELAGSDRELAARPPPAGRRWLVNAQGQTLAVVPEPPPFRMGAPRGETGQQVGLEDPHPVRIPRSFALTTTEVTVAQFRVFLHATGAGDHHQHRFAPDLECPMTEVSWFQAARYCRWLSERERIPPDQMCYPPLDQIRPGMKPYPDFLHRTGYRLPTEAEWEYACRAGAATSRFFGSSDELLRRYGWYLFSAHDQTHPVARLKPNDLGLFDIYGNVWEWCHERLDFPPADGQVAVDAERPDDVLREPEGRAVRGGAFASHPWHVRTGYRAGSRPDDRGIASGFRIARTWRPAN